MLSVEEVVAFLEQHDFTLVTAESCTGGLITSLLADVRGSGQVLERGYVVYAPRAKNECLGVSYDTIQRYGLSSAKVAEEMALGALRNSQAVIAVSNTGLAEIEGEAGGAVYFGWAMRKGGQEQVITEKVRFLESRNEVREAAARYALAKVPSVADYFCG
ncbi:MAG: nicotinamide-nucleotide amidohydrolase family protein [Anaerolineaceae bacterium]|nr:nicotinamide-nucleotide amidohydrolase family protein [Anaerolineaceae bacterium]